MSRLSRRERRLCAEDAGVSAAVSVWGYVSAENKKKEHGILKSLGFVSGEIVYQTVISILPCCLLGAAIGLVFAGAFSNDLIVMNLTNMGIFQFGSKPSPFYLLLCGVALIVFVIIYTVLLSRSVKKIAPHDLFNRE